MLLQNYNEHPSIVSPWFQVVLMGITSCVFVSMLFINLQQFETLETDPAINALSIERFEKVQQAAPVVETGIFIRDFSEFDILHGKFAVDVVVWFTFDPTQVKPELIDRFVFEKAEEQTRSLPFMRVDTEHKRIVEYSLRLTFAMPLNYRHFPLDDHRINFVMNNYFLSPEQAFFMTNPAALSLNPEIHIEGWRIVGVRAQSGYFENTINLNNAQQDIYYPRVVFSLDFERAGLRQIVSIMLPLLIIFFSTLLTFAVSPVGSDYFNVIALSVASIMALIAYRFVIETISPNTGYFVLSDYIFLFFLIATLCILLLNSLGETISAQQKKIATVVLHIFVIVVFIYFLAPWW